MSERYDNMVEDYERIIYERDKAYAKLQAELEYHKTLTAAQQRVAELEQWSKCAEEAMRKLVDAHEQLNRPKLERALMGIKILLGPNQ